MPNERSSKAERRKAATIGCHKTALSAASKYISRPFPQVTADGWREAVVNGVYREKAEKILKKARGE